MFCDTFSVCLQGDGDVSDGEEVGFRNGVIEDALARARRKRARVNYAEMHEGGPADALNNEDDLEMVEVGSPGRRLMDEPQEEQDPEQGFAMRDISEGCSELDGVPLSDEQQGNEQLILLDACPNVTVPDVTTSLAERVASEVPDGDCIEGTEEILVGFAEPNSPVDLERDSTSLDGVLTGEPCETEVPCQELFDMNTSERLWERLGDAADEEDCALAEIGQTEKLQAGSGIDTVSEDVVISDAAQVSDGVSDTSEKEISQDMIEVGHNVHTCWFAQLSCSFVRVIFLYQYADV